MPNLTPSNLKLHPLKMKNIILQLTHGEGDTAMQAEKEVANFAILSMLSLNIMGISAYLSPVTSVFP